MLLKEIKGLDAVADDYERAGITDAETLARMTVAEVCALDINGIGPARADKHIMACVAALEEPVSETEIVADVAPAKSKGASIAGHPALTYLDQKMAERVMNFADHCKRITDAKAWLDHVLKRCVLSGDPAHAMYKFAKALEIRLV